MRRTSSPQRRSQRRTSHRRPSDNLQVRLPSVDLLIWREGPNRAIGVSGWWWCFFCCAFSSCVRSWLLALAFLAPVFFGLLPCHHNNLGETPNLWPLQILGRAR